MNTETEIHCEWCGMLMQEVEELSCGDFTLHMLICPECGETSTRITRHFLDGNEDFFQLCNPTY